MDKLLDMIGEDRVAKGLYWTKALSLVEGCTPVSPGCAHCWSAAQTHMRKGQKNPKIKARYSGLTTEKGCFNGKVRLMDETLDLPLKTRKPTAWAVWNDFFHPSVTLDFQAEALSVMRRCPQHIFLICTKQAKWLAIFNRVCGWSAESYPNIWLGVTVESSEYLYRIDELLKVDAAVRWVSIEPMLGAIDLTVIGCPHCGQSKQPWLPNYTICRACGREVESPPNNRIDWVVAGPETGPNRRWCDLRWIRDLKNQCEAAKVPFFLKALYESHKKLPMPVLDGRTWSELPGREA